MSDSMLKNTLTRWAFWSILTVLPVAGATSISFATEIVAHRGASYDAPENTLASVNLAWEQKADAVEIDVYLTKDGKIVLMHDRTPKRYGGPDTPVESMTWDELKGLDVGAWKDPKFKGITPPLLEDVVKDIPDGKRLFIEIKSGPEIVPELKRVLKAANRPAAQTAVISFNQQVIERTVKEIPEIQAYWVLSMEDKNKNLVDVNWVISTAKKIKTHGVDIGGKTARITPEFVKAIHDEGIPVYVWTVNDPAEAERIAAMGVLGITTDRPGLLREHGIGNHTSANIHIPSQPSAK